MDKLKPARKFIRRQLLLDVGFQFFWRSKHARLEHDVGLGFDQFVSVHDANHGGFKHGRVVHQASLHLERRDVNAADLEHVVAAAAIGVKPVSIDRVFVATARPFAGKCGFGFTAVVPVHDGRAGAVDLQLADLADAARLAVVAHNAQRVAGHGLAGGAVAHLAGPVA